jgi:hypothetical protein
MRKSDSILSLPFELFNPALDRLTYPLPVAGELFLQTKPGPLTAQDPQSQRRYQENEGGQQKGSGNRAGKEDQKI